VSRASAVRQSQREKKVSKAASKPRGAKAKKAREAQFLKLTPEN
jgi:hypothetical protein